METSATRYISVISHGKKEWLPLRALVRVEADSNYSRLHLASGRTVLVAKVLKKLEAQLPSHLFMRIHSSHLVNRQYIRATGDPGCKTISLRNGEHVDVSRSKRKNVKAQLAGTPLTEN